MQPSLAHDDRHHVYNTLNRPLTLCGIDRRLFFVGLLLGAATFNLFYSLLAGLLVFALIYGLSSDSCVGCATTPTGRLTPRHSSTTAISITSLRTQRSTATAPTCSSTTTTSRSSP
jgi:hypothetical protein